MKSAKNDSYRPDWWKSYFDADYLYAHSHLDAARSREEARAVIELLGLKAGELLLDACCGQGRHEAEFAAQGNRVVGVDYAGPLLRAAQESAKRGKSKRRPVFVRGDVRRLPFESAFDAAVCLFNSFGYFAEAAHDLRFLQEVHGALKAGGRFLLDVANRDVMVLYPVVKNWRETGEGYVLEETSMDWVTNISTTHHILIRGGRAQQKRTHTIRLYTLSELTQLFAAAGFWKVRAFGGLDGAPFQPMSPHITMIGERVA